MRSKFYLISILFFFIAVSVYPQQFGSNVIGSNDKIQSEKIVSPKKSFSPDVSVTLGTSFSSFGRGYNAFSTYIMPEFTFPVTQKFAVRAGIGYSSLFYPNSGFENPNQAFNQYGSIYVSGLYQLSEKITIAGTAYKTFPLNQQTPQANPQALDFSNEGIIVDVEYKVTDNFRINAGFSYQKQNPYNYYYNPGGLNSFGSPFNSPYGNSMFSPGF